MKYIALLILCFLGFAHADLPSHADCLVELDATEDDDSDDFYPTSEQIAQPEDVHAWLDALAKSITFWISTNAPQGLSRSSVTWTFYYRHSTRYYGGNYAYGKCKKDFKCILRDVTNAQCWACKTPGAKNYAPEYAFHNESSCEYNAPCWGCTCLEVKNAYLENCNDCNAID